MSQTTFRAATEEAREELGVEPVFGMSLDRESIAAKLESIGEAGAEAAQRMREARRYREEPEDSFDGIDPPEWSLDVPDPMRVPRPRSEAEREAIVQAQADAARELFLPPPERSSHGRESDTAAQLVAGSLLDDDPLVRAAAAAATIRVDSRNPVAEDILNEGARSDNDELAEFSRAVLVDDRRSETRRIEIVHERGARDPRADSVIIHGTWARRGKWWRPDGRLHRHLRGDHGLFPHLYQGARPFEWSAYFSFRVWGNVVGRDWNREQAAHSLAWWAHRHLTPEPDIVGHSYGGSLAMLATKAEKSLRGVVLLSPAVHNTCLPDPSYYEHILHVTSKLDLVLLADLSRPRLLRGMPNVTEFRVRRKGLHGHSSTHDPAIWRASGLTDFVRDSWLPSLSART